MNSESVKRLWERWDIRVIILLSLLLQIILIFSAPLRKRMSKWYISMPMWVAYLSADVTAIYGVGLISKSHLIDPAGGVPVNPELLVFWAPFFVVHLGGPDTITAFSLEDNEFWLRHSLSFASQCVIQLYIFYLGFSNNKLLLPAVLMFCSGAIKYGERVRSLYLGSSNGFRDSLLTAPDPGPDYAKLMDELSSRHESGLPASIDQVRKPQRVKKVENPEDEESLTDLEIVQHAHRYFMTFKGLIADMIFSFRERRDSRLFFIKRNSREAFKIVQVELNFIYETLYTKAQVVQGAFGHLCRISSFGLTCAALLLFQMKESKDTYEEFDVVITYVLLIGAIALDVVAFTMVLFSDWTAVALSKSDSPQYAGTNICMMLMSRFIEKAIIKTTVRKLLGVDRTRWTEKKMCFPMKVVSQRWSNTISQHSLIDCCLRPRSEFFKSVIGLVGLTKILDSIQYVVTTDFEDRLWDSIFDHIRMNARVAEDLDTATKFYSARGDWILNFTGHSNLLPWVNKVDFDESVFLWHIATDLLYCTDDDDEDYRGFRRMSKTLSDYMSYLLIMQNSMMSTVAGISLIRYRDTCAETVRFFRRRNLTNEKHCYPKISCFGNSSDIESQLQETRGDSRRANACHNILSLDTRVKPLGVKGDRSKSLLFDASVLAKELSQEGFKWLLIFRVWVEMMCYAASHCTARNHAAQLSKGGQLITLVWLLMTHFGFGNRYQINEGHVRAKLSFGR